MEFPKLVLEHFRNPQNMGKMKNPDITASEQSEICGDVITLYLKMKGNVIKDIKFESLGCAANIASTSLMTTLVKGKTIEEAEKITWKDLVKALGGLPETKYHCCQLVIKTLRSAIKKWKQKK